MKTRILSFIFGIMAIAALTSCGDDDVASSQVPDVVKESFAKLYPKTSTPSWQLWSPYYIAEFNYNTFETKAWFDSDGAWAMTETDYDNNVNFLPMEVSNAFNNSQYSSWIVEDALMYQRVADSFCEIEVESLTGRELTIFYDSYGNVLNTIPEFDYDITPTTIIDAL